MKSLLKLGKTLSKTEQKQISGGTGCTVYPANQCLACGGSPQSSGCCRGTAETHACLQGQGGGGCSPFVPPEDC